MRAQNSFTWLSYTVITSHHTSSSVGKVSKEDPFAGMFRRNTTRLGVRAAGNKPQHHDIRGSWYLTLILVVVLSIHLTESDPSPPQVITTVNRGVTSECAKVKEDNERKTEEFVAEVKKTGQDNDNDDIYVKTAKKNDELKPDSSVEKLEDHSASFIQDPLSPTNTHAQQESTKDPSREENNPTRLPPSDEVPTSPRMTEKPQGNAETSTFTLKSDKSHIAWLCFTLLW